MKKLLLVFVSSFAWCVTAPAADALAESLQKGLLEEEVNRDLPAAVKAYETAVEQAEAQRQTAATAVFRLAESFRKLGQTNQAVALYRRILVQYADQASLAALSRTNLALLAPEPPDLVRRQLTAAAQRQKDLLQQELALVEEQIKNKQLMTDAGRAPRDEVLALQRESLSLQRQMAALESQVRVDLLDLGVPVPTGAAAPALPTVDPADVASVREEIALVERELASHQARLRNGKAEAVDVRRTQTDLLQLQRKLPENATVDRQVALLQEELKLTEENLAEVRRRIEVGAAAPLDENPYRRELLAIQRELGAVQRLAAGAAPAPPASGGGAAPATNEEADEIQRIQAIIQNSPDLVNARNAPDTQSGTPLHAAAAKGYLAVAEFLLANGADVNAPDANRQSPLHIAAAAGHKTIGELFLSKGADPQASDYKGFTPLHLAAAKGYLAVVETLLAAGAEVNTQANPGGAPTPQPDWASSPLHSAAEQGFPAVVELLLKNDAGINARDRGGQTPLVRAIRKGQTATVRLLLEQGADPNALDATGQSALFWAVAGKQAPLVGLLLEHQAAVDARITAPDPEGDWTVLFRAVWDGEAALTRQLLDAGADLNARAASGITPVHEAVLKNMPATLRALLERKPEVNVRDSGGNTPLHYAMEAGALELVEALLAAGADPNATGWTQGTDQPWPPLCKAIEFNEPLRTALMTALLKHGADVNARITNGWTALHRAVQYNLDPAVQFLVANKADVNARGSRPKNDPKLGERRAVLAAGTVTPEPARAVPVRGLRRPDLPQPGLPAEFPQATFANNFGSPGLPADKDVTPLHVAVANLNLELARVLLEHGADVNARDAESRTPLHFGIKSRDLELVRLLLDAKADPNAKDSTGWAPLRWVRDLTANQPPMGISRFSRGMVVTATRQDLERLLRERGAKADLSDPNAITVSRSSSGYSAKVLTRGGHDWNQFTLLEMLAIQYDVLVQSGVREIRPQYMGTRYAGGTRESGVPLAFPDLARIRISRPLPAGGEQEISVDLSAVVKTGDCGGDVALAWGDVVEIPEEDHPLDSRWELSDELRTTLKKCLERKVEIIIKGDRKTYQLQLPYRRAASGQGWDRDAGPQRLGWDVRTTLERSGWLRTSSDRAGVLVRRIDPVIGTLQEWRVDCTPASKEADLWLRDGDVIEVPDKPEATFAPPRTGVVRVVGEVKRPGTVSVGLGPRKDLIDAIAESGGLTENARSRIEFTRDGQTQTLSWDQLKAEADPEKKVWLQPGDLIEVKRSVL